MNDTFAPLGGFGNAAIIRGIGRLTNGCEGAGSIGKRTRSGKIDASRVVGQVWNLEWGRFGTWSGAGLKPEVGQVWNLPPSAAIFIPRNGPRIAGLDGAGRHSKTTLTRRASEG